MVMQPDSTSIDSIPKPPLAAIIRSMSGWDAGTTADNQRHLLPTEDTVVIEGEAECKKISLQVDALK